MSKNSKFIVGVAGAVLLATAVGLAFYKLSQEDEDYYTKKIKKIRKDFNQLADNFKSKKEIDPSGYPAPAEDEFGIFL